MKKILYTLSIVLAVSTFCACNDNDTIGVFYYPDNSEAIFTSSKSEYFFTAADLGEYEVTVQRANSKGSAEVEVINSDTTGLFTIPGIVFFEDGELEATIKVTFEKEQLEIGTPYTIGLQLPETPIEGKQISHKLTITRDYTWEFFTECTATTYLYGESTATIYKALENPSYIKIKDLYSEGHELKLLLGGDGSISMLQDVNSYGYYDMETGFIHPSYGMIYTYIDADRNYSYFDEAQNTIVLSMYYYVGAGAFGWKDDVITW